MDPVERVKNMVRHTLVVKPDVSNRELLNRAREIAPEAVEGLSLRQFHGRFRLPVVRFELTPKQRTKRNGTAEAAVAQSSAGSTENEISKTASAEAEKKPAQPKRKRGRKKAAEASPAIDGAIRDVLIEFAVELEKAESRSQLVSVIADVDGFVKRIVSVAAAAYGPGRRSAA